MPVLAAMPATAASSSASASASSSSASSASSSSTAASSAFEKLLLLSWYAPIIVCVCFVALSAFASAPINGLMFFGFFFLSSALRALVPRTHKPASACRSSGFFLGAAPDYTYSVFSIAFALAYLVFPMTLATVTTGNDVMNYLVLFLFVAYLVFDIFVKKIHQCADAVDIARDAILGLASAVGATAIAYFVEPLKPLLFVQPTGPATCSSSSSSSASQKFKCHMYRNGQLVA